MKLFLALLIALFAGRSSAQSIAATQDSAMQHVVLIKLSPESANSFEPLFASLPEKDIQAAKFTSSEEIASLTGIRGLTILSIKPLIPQHSVVYPKMRRATNPALFGDASALTPRPREYDEFAILAKSEESISRWFVLEYSDRFTPQEAAQRAKRTSAFVERAEPKYLKRPLYTPNDTYISSQWGLEAIHAFEAWDIIKGQPSTLAADVDNGTDWMHEDLRAAIYENSGEIGLDADGHDKRANGIDDDNNGFIDDWHGWDFGGSSGVSSDNDPRGNDSHGTHTGGTIAATGDNGKGVAGVAYGIKLLPIKGSDDGGGFISFGYEGIIYAADMGAKVINSSWGGTSRGDVEQDIVNYAYGKDAALCVAAGNNSLFQDFYPASYDHVLSVTGLSQLGVLDAAYSNYGTRVDLVAPGSAIISTVRNDEYRYSGGTSMAAPHATGALALVRQKYPELSAGQAMERLRATADPIIDSVRPQVNDLTGHGKINLFRAVSEPNVFSARIESFRALDDNGNGKLEAGENGHIVLFVRNYLGAVKNLTAHIEVIDTQSAIAEVSDVPFGNGNTLQLLENLQAAFPIHINEYAHDNSRVLIKVTFSDKSVGYAPDVDYFTLTVSPTYKDLNQNNLLVTLNSAGSIGYNDPTEHSQGSGFVWKNPPPSITLRGRSVIFQGGLMIGEDADHLAVVAPSDQGSITEQDFATVLPIDYVSPVDRLNARQELLTKFVDTKKAADRQVGVSVEERGYALSEGLAENAIALSYQISSRQTELGILPTDEVSAALFFDWDIGLSGAANRASYDAATNTAIAERIDANYPFVGIRIVSELPAGASINYFAIDNDGSNGSVNTYYSFDDHSKWLSMTEQRLSAGPGDISQVFGLKNIRLNSLGDVTLTYVIGLGTSRENVIATLDEAEAKWKSGLSVESCKVSESVQIHPNPASQKVNISLPVGEWTMRITNLLGQQMTAAALNRAGTQSVDVSSWASGTYFVQLQNSVESIVRPFQKE